jgi:DNA-binding IclR family transcriptional regulator
MLPEPPIDTAPVHLQPGPIRDAVGLVAQATRGGDFLTLRDLSDRTGVPIIDMARRMSALEAAGYVARVELTGREAFTATRAGEAALAGWLW